MLFLSYSTLSPFARRVRIVLAELGLTYTSDVEDRLRPADEIGALSPALQVPVLEDAGWKLFGSLLIQEYLLAQYPNRAAVGDAPLAPSAVRPARQWDDRQVLVALDTASDAYLTIRMLGSDAAQSPYLARHFDRIQRIVDWLESQLAEDAFWPSALSLADINLACLLLHAESRGQFTFRDRWLQAAALVARCERRPSFAATAYPAPA
jgi:glutathione S-transferase